jgi:hypothetical protein
MFYGNLQIDGFQTQTRFENDFAQQGQTVLEFFKLFEKAFPNWQYEYQVIEDTIQEKYLKGCKSLGEI